MLGQLHRKISLPLLFLLTLLACTCLACSSSNPDTADHRQGQKKEMKAPLADFEATLDPSDYDEEIEVVQKKQEEE
ncbi:MAG TPA: hypothetical protein VI758_08075, partial [Bacteroidota bacterium]